MRDALKKFEDVSVITKLNLFVALMVGALVVAPMVQAPFDFDHSWSVSASVLSCRLER